MAGFFTLIVSLFTLTSCQADDAISRDYRCFFIFDTSLHPLPCQLTGILGNTGHFCTIEASHRDGYRQLNTVRNFDGNAEGRDVLDGPFDVIVCDGFTGNVCLKTIEGTAKTLFSELKGIMMASLKSKIGALLIKGELKKLVSSIDPDAAGGAPLLGVKGACIVGHGSSNARAIKNGVLAAAEYVRSGVSELIAQTV